MPAPLPDGPNRRRCGAARPLGGTLVVTGSRLDGQAVFRQEFKGAGGPPGYWRSTVLLPEAGCGSYRPDRRPVGRCRHRRDLVELLR